MSPHELIEDMKQRGVRLTALGSRLRVRAPAGSVTTELREALTANSAAQGHRSRPMTPLGR